MNTMHNLDFIKTIKDLRTIINNLENENFPAETTDQIHDIIIDLKDDMIKRQNPKHTKSIEAIANL